MPRPPITNSENIPPHPITNPPSTKRNPLTPRTNLPKSNPTPKPQSTRSRRRPALGDITNKTNSNHLSSTNSIPTRFKSATKAHSFKPRPPPVDNFGNIETPHIVPQDRGPVYDPPALFDHLEIANIRRKRETEVCLREEEEEEKHWTSLLGRDSSLGKVELVNDDHDAHHTPLRLGLGLGLGLGGGIALDEMLHHDELLLDEGGRQ